MRKAQGVEDLAGRLSQAAATPLITSVHTAQPEPSQRPRKAAAVPVFLRVPRDLYERLDAEAIARTKATGRGVTVQQIILDKAAG
jgi:hypothetical protein